ncbi:28S ribosomal protein S5, mitochondrial, partial [Lates japonicus]
MAATIRVCCALRITVGGVAPLRTVVGAAQVSQFASRASAASLQRSPALPPFPATAWQQARHGSFFNKLTAEELWKGVLAETGAGARKGRGKRTKRKMKKDLNRGQSLGEGKGGFLWPGLNAPMIKDGAPQTMSQRGKEEQEEVQAERARQRDEWDRKRKMRVKRERGWTGNSWGGISLGPPDPGPNGVQEDDMMKKQTKPIRKPTQTLANKKKLHVVEFQEHRGPLPMVVASPTEGAQPNPEPEDEIPNTRLHWNDVRAVQGTKRSLWAGVKRTI